MAAAVQPQGLPQPWEQAQGLAGQRGGVEGEHPLPGRKRGPGEGSPRGCSPRPREAGDPRGRDPLAGVGLHTQGGLGGAPGAPEEGVQGAQVPRTQLLGPGSLAEVREAAALSAL